MSRSKSSKKMGKTMCPKKKFRYFSSCSQKSTENLQIVHSAGYLNKVRCSSSTVLEILQTEFNIFSWRQGQEESLASVLSHQNTLLVLPTGTGKSLIYQLAARLLGGLTIVISPLLSLINDQILRLPSCLSASALHSSISYGQYFQVLSDAKSGKLDILFATPEKFLSEHLYDLPQISLVCVDEAHCASKFSTSSRLAYLALPPLLTKFTVLALTAAADSLTLQDCQQSLGIKKTVQHGPALRGNFNITVSREADTLTAVGKIVKTDRFRSGSVLVYCYLQYMTETVAQWLRSKGENCASYHGGMAESARSMVQEGFITGKIRVMVATVAFGMGIDKADIAGVIHLHCPKSIEQFIQESGRAGRNGDLVNVHVIIDENSLYSQRALVYSNHITKRLLLKVLKSLRPATLKRERDEDYCKGPVVNMKIGETCEDLGLSKEGLLLLFAYLKEKGVVTEVEMGPVSVAIGFHKTAPEELAKKYAIVSHILTSGKKLVGSRRIYLPSLAASVNLPLSDTIKVIKRLAATGELSAEFSDESFILTSGNVPTDTELISFTAEAEEHFSTLEETFRKKIETCFMLLDRVAKDCYHQCSNSCAELQSLFEDYLLHGYYDEIPLDSLCDISSEVHVLSSELKSVPCAKDITCILQGINTERTPYARWKHSYLWGRYKRFRFGQVLSAAAQVLLDDDADKRKHSVLDAEVVEGA
jgi:ATP-dependent DNA helicase Q4